MPKVGKVRFWDTSAVLPLIVVEACSPEMSTLLRTDTKIVAWWATRVECASGIARLRREGSLEPDDEPIVRGKLDYLSSTWLEVSPRADVRTVAERVLYSYSLRAADALQLAAALRWAESELVARTFVCLDSRLRGAAGHEGLDVLPHVW